jgi:thiol-disulfide isomerase/thioredoxin
MVAPPGPSSPPSGADLPPEEPAPAIRGSAGDLPVLTLEGKPAKLSDYGGKVTMIALWATWCEPCVQELPLYDTVYREYRDNKDVSVIAVNVDDVADVAALDRVRATVKKLGLSVPVLVDRERAVQWRFEVKEAHAGKKKSAEPNEPAIPLPMLVTIDPQFRFTRQFGFHMGSTTIDYVKAKAALIELALVGNLPAEKLPAYVLGEPPPPSDGKLTFVNMSIDELHERWPDLRAQLKSMFKMSDQRLARLLKQAEASARKGEPVTIELPRKVGGPRPAATKTP